MHTHTHTDNTCLYTQHTHSPTLFTTHPMRQRSLLGASSNYSHLEVTSGPPRCCFICHRHRVEEERDAEERGRHQEHVGEPPQGNGIIQYYSDSSGKRALQHCSSSSSGHPGRLWAIIGPDLWDDGRLTHQCLLNAGVNMPKELSNRGFLQCCKEKCMHEVQFAISCVYV